MSLASFNVNGPGEGLGAAAQADYDEAYGVGTGVTANTVNDFSADLATNLGIGTGSVATAGAAQVDDNGNWFVDVTITAASDSEVKALSLQGIEATNGTGVTFQVALDPSEATVASGSTNAAYNVTGADLGAKDLLSSATANPMEQLDAALKQVDELRSGLGAIQNRFESAITNLQTNETNLSAARSRIEDADYASEVANMTRAQILQQAGTSVLAQANQTPQNVLSLLG